MSAREDFLNGKALVQIAEVWRDALEKDLTEVGGSSSTSALVFKLHLPESGAMSMFSYDQRSLSNAKLSIFMRAAIAEHLEPIMAEVVAKALAHHQAEYKRAEDEAVSFLRDTVKP